MKKLYEKHKCHLLIPLALLIAIDILAFFHITDDIVYWRISTTNELLIFILSLTMTYYYIYKNVSNIRKYIRIITKFVRGKR